jgi:hypothetical protein
MRSIWQSLAWKEWHEHRWKLVSVLAVIWSLTVVVFLLGKRDPHVLAESYYVAVVLGGIPMAIFIGLSAAAGERSRGTLPFLQALPVPLWRVAIHKLSFALLSAIVPVLLTGFAVAVLVAIFPVIGLAKYVDMPKWSLDGRPLWNGSWIMDVSLTAIVATGSLIVWAAVCGNNRKDEVSAGAIALVLMACWWSALTILWVYFLKGTTEPDTARLRAVGAASAPLGFFMIRDIAGSDQGCLLLGYVASVLVYVSLVARYVMRFGRVDHYGNRSPREAADKLHRSEFLARPRRFAFTSIAWKQLRESCPVALAGLAAIIVISICFCVASSYLEKKWVNNAGQIYSLTAIIFGFFIAVVAGIGIALHDVGSNLSTFWRSRPIQPDMWFWTKFVTGLGIVLAAIYVPIGLFAAFGDRSINEVMKYPDAITVAAAQVAVFAAAVMLTCLVRQAVYAAILSIATVYLGLLTSQLALVGARYTGLISADRSIWTEPTPNEIMVGLLTTFVVCAVVAWLAMRYDWGRKSRY